MAETWSAKGEAIRKQVRVFQYELLREGSPDTDIIARAVEQSLNNLVRDVQDLNYMSGRLDAKNAEERERA